MTIAQSNLKEVAEIIRIYFAFFSDYLSEKMGSVITSGGDDARSRA